MKRLFTSCFGLGFLPIAPGTWGSLTPAALLFLLGSFGTSVGIISAVMAGLVIAGSVICITCAPAVSAQIGKEDPGEIVADEFAGQAVTFLAIIHLSQANIYITACLGFLLFRLFDIIKPWPIRKLEKLPAGWGILADDLLAGLYAAILLLIICQNGIIKLITDSLSNQSLSIFTAIILGAIQGLTEFLPVSSSGHLVLFEHIFKFDTEKPEILLFDLVIHVGTIIAIFLVFRKSIAAFLT